MVYLRKGLKSGVSVYTIVVAVFDICFDIKFNQDGHFC